MYSYNAALSRCFFFAIATLCLQGDARSACCYLFYYFFYKVHFIKLLNSQMQYVCHALALFSFSLWLHFNYNLLFSKKKKFTNKQLNERTIASESAHFVRLTCARLSELSRAAHLHSNFQQRCRQQKQQQEEWALAQSFLRASLCCCFFLAATDIITAGQGRM